MRPSLSNWRRLLAASAMISAIVFCCIVLLKDAKLGSKASPRLVGDVYFWPEGADVSFRVNDEFASSIRLALAGVAKSKDVARIDGTIPWGAFVCERVAVSYRAGKLCTWDAKAKVFRYVEIPQLRDFDAKVSEALENSGVPLTSKSIWLGLMEGFGTPMEK